MLLPIANRHIHRSAVEPRIYALITSTRISEMPYGALCPFLRAARSKDISSISDDMLFSQCAIHLLIRVQLCSFVQLLLTPHLCASQPESRKNRKPQRGRRMAASWSKGGGPGAPNPGRLPAHASIEVWSSKERTSSTSASREGCFSTQCRLSTGNRWRLFWAHPIGTHK